MTRALQYALAGVAAILLIWFAPQLGARIRAIAPVQTSALGACPMPTEFEQLHIRVWLLNGHLVSECMYVGTRGTYGGKR